MNNPNTSSSTFLGGRVIIMVGDITKQDTGAIVNAANSSLMGGAGVDGAIHQAGGPAILESCREIRRTQYPQGLPTGEAVITPAGNLPSRFVIHTVGPIYGEHQGREAELLAACYKNSLLLAAQHALASIAIPAISTGAFSYPSEQAAGVASQAIEEYLSQDERINEVRLIFFQPRGAEAFLKNHKFS